MEVKLIMIIISLILIIQVMTQMNPYIFKGNNIKYVPRNNTLRRMSTNDNYEPIRISPDFTYIKYQSQENSSLVQIETKIEESINNAIKILKKLINVHPLTEPINKISSDDLIQWGFKQNNINKSLLFDGNGINSDLIILLKFIESGEENLLLDNEMASISNKFILDETTKRPIIGVIYINNNIDIKRGNIDIYLKALFLHELTHILGFHYDLFQYYPGGLEGTIETKNEERTKVEKKFIKTPNVLKFAKKYFNCKEIDGVELENQNNLLWSHWEARILLGEYMTSSPYTPEQVISEFTLALLEDSQWYKINNYTGGLMRFGKNKGCEFLKNDCNNKNLVSNFKFEFCDFEKGNHPTCSAGRQSRTYCKSYTNVKIEPAFSKYKRFNNHFGRIDADYCPVNDIETEEEKELYYVGNCKYGNGKYGTHNNFGNELLNNEQFEEILGEKYGPNSFCALSTILPEEDIDKFNSYENEVRAICYPMFCSSKSLTVQIYDQFIVCPVEGGKVEIDGKYKGYLICPDYNLICTGTKFCNDMFDCVEKGSLPKEDTYNYKYTINYDEEKIYKIEEIAELGEDGLCPKNCAKCGNDKACLKWTENNWKIENNTLNKDFNIDDIIKDYIDKNNNEKIIEYYKNDNSSIIIYSGKGNKNLLDTISSDNEKKIITILNENYPNDDNKTIKVILNENGNEYIGVYDEQGNKLDIKNDCPECSEIKLNIKNNYEINLKNKLGESITEVIINNKINIFDDEDETFKDICSNFTISGIDIPLDSRKNLFYLGDNKNDIICGNSKCDIIKDNYNSNNLEGECKCKINLNFDNITQIGNNQKANKKKKMKNLPSSETAKNTFEIFKCFKNGKFLKANEGFYITLCSIGVQSVCFALYIIFTPKLPLLPGISIANPISKKNNTNNNTLNNNSIKSEESGDIMNDKDENQNETDSNQKENNLVKIEDNVINYGNIDEEIDEDKFSYNNNKNNNGIGNTNFHFRDTNEIKLDTIKIENKANFKLNRNLSHKSMNEGTKSLDEKDELNKFNKKKVNILINTNNNINNINVNTANTNMNIYVTTAGENNKPRETLDNFSLHGSVNKKLNIKEKEIRNFEEEIDINNKKVLILFNKKNKKKEIKNEKNFKNYEKNKEIPLDYLPIGKAIQYDKRSFGIIYWCVFSFKQPIVNCFSFLESFHITRSCIPIQMKLIRFLLMIILNIFINSMTLTQNYFKTKYEYFNEKYQIEETINVKIKIDPLERLSYAMKHCFPEVIITFFICIISQYIINFIFFGIRRELCLISINEKKENINKEVNKLIKKTKFRYIIFSFINLVFMIIFFVYLTNFTTAYSGGALDYIGAGIWTFILLQILPFISSLLITFLRYYGIKENKEGMYKMSQILLT